MATLLEDDELGKTLAEPTFGAASSTSKPSTDADTKEIEDYANDPANASDKSDKSKSGTDGVGGAGGAAGAALAKSTPAGRALQAVAGFAGNNKKGLGIGGGVGALILLITLAFTALLPLKIESLMKNVLGNRYNPIQHAMERRAEKVFIKYAMQNSSTFATDKAIVASGNPLGDLYKTWRTQSFEKDLANKYGLKIERSTVSGKTIRITTPQGTQDFANTNDMTNFLDKDLSHLEAKTFINDTIKAETKWFQVLKRHHLRIWFRNAYGINRWRVFDGSKGKDADTNVNKTITTAETDGYKNAAGEDLACITGDAASCPDKDGHTSKSGSAATDPAATTTEQAVSDGLDQATTEATDKKVGTDLTKIISEKLSASAVKAVASKAIPIVGWLSFAASADDLLWNDKIDAIIKNVRKVQYASVFATWLTISDQIKSGQTVSGDEVNVAMSKLDGAEKSNAEQCIYANNCSGGTKIDPSKTVGTTFGQSLKDAYYTANPVGKPGHYFLAAYKNTVGALVNWLGGILGGLLGDLLKLIPGVTNFETWVSQHLTQLMLFVIGPVVSGAADTGDVTANAIDAGADVSANDFAQSIGGQQLSGIALQEMNSAVAADPSLHPASGSGVWNAIASTDNPTSLASRLIARLPSSPSTAAKMGMSEMTTMMGAMSYNLGNIMISLFSRSIPPAFAGTVINPGIVDKYGIDQYGFTEAALSQDINTAVLDQATQTAIQRDPTVKRADGSIDVSKIEVTDCPDVAPSQANLCRLDLVTIQSLESVYNTADNGGLGGTATGAASAAGSTAITGTYSLPVDHYTLGPGFGRQGPMWGPAGHTGMDFVVPSGTPLRAVADGILKDDSNGAPYGIQTELFLPDGTGFLYCHQSRRIPNFKVGMAVKAGDIIGYSGATGNVSGPHLHFEYGPKGKFYTDAADPLIWFNLVGLKVPQSQ